MWTGRYRWARAPTPYSILHPIPNKPYGFCGCETLKTKAQEPCEQVGTGGPELSLPIPFFTPSLISPVVSVDIKHHERKLVRLFTGSNTDFDRFPVWISKAAPHPLPSTIPLSLLSATAIPLSTHSPPPPPPPPPPTPLTTPLDVQGTGLSVKWGCQSASLSLVLSPFLGYMCIECMFWLE